MRGKQILNNVPTPKHFFLCILYWAPARALENCDPVDC